ncbi:N-Acylneuraminate-9-Phosphatase [Manis pentadactyla]|nr:N-Acylneuraminate-9-Phosphatase [Manis pentadactyla]
MIQGKAFSSHCSAAPTMSVYLHPCGPGWGADGQARAPGCLCGPGACRHRRVLGASCAEEEAGPSALPGNCQMYGVRTGICRQLPRPLHCGEDHRSGARANLKATLALAAPAAWLVLRLLSRALLLAEIPSWLSAVVQSHPHRRPWKPGARPARSQDFGTGPPRIVQTSSAAR